jgi:hypothetical protein
MAAPPCLVPPAAVSVLWTTDSGLSATDSRLRTMDYALRTTDNGP